jgi:glycosyltransferase involved in cell wall biosynthesis
MQEFPKVSIIIPCYNALPYIKETLESVLRQTYKNIELIIVDDGSTDGSFEFLNSLKLPNLILKKNKSKGACSARNYGLEFATGDYIQFLDADDLLSNNKIEEQVKLIANKAHCIAICSTSHFYNDFRDGKVVDKEFMMSTNEPTQFLLKLFGGNGINHSMVSQHAYLTPRSIIEKIDGWNEQLLKDQDGEFFTRVVMASKGIYYSPTVYAYYRKHVHGKNIANQNQYKHITSQLEALRSKIEQLSIASDTIDFKNAFALQYKILAINAYPEYIDIYKQAIESSEALGGSKYLPVLGGKLIESIKYIFGWKSAKLFRLFLHQVRDKLQN